MNSIPKPSANRWALAACLFFIVLGCRWAMVDRFDMDLPVWDQWDAEGIQVLAPWFEHHLTVGDFLRPHNEHRVVLTKLANFALTVANGQWDQRLEAAANAALPGIIAAAFFLMVCRGLDRRWHAPLFVLLAAAYALPMAWQNVLGGFHSQQFFLIGLSFGAIAWLPQADPWSRRWWLGAACAVLALGSMASGFFAAAVVLGLLVVRLLRRETSLRSTTPALVLCGCLVALACATFVSVDYHEVLKAHNAHDFATTVVRSLEWPAAETAWAAVLFWLPWCCLTWRWLRGQAADIDIGRPNINIRGLTPSLVGLGGWVLLQILATAYARGAGGPAPASRYIDTLVFGLVVNGIAIGWLWRHGSAGGWGRPILVLFGLGWATAVGAGFYNVTDEVLRYEMPPLRLHYYFCEQNTRNYLATGDEAWLRSIDIPYPGTESYLSRLRVAALRSILPVGVRPPLALEGAGHGSAFVRHDSRSPQGSTGVSPATRPLSNRVTWGSFGRAGGAAGSSWESAPLRASHGGWLKFEVAGQPGEPGVSLELRDAVTRKMLARVQPASMPNDAWRSAYVPAPSGPFIVVARDHDPKRWLAFSQPVEMGTLSYWAKCGVNHGVEIAIAAAGAALLLGMISWRAERNRSGPVKPCRGPPPYSDTKALPIKHFPSRPLLAAAFFSLVVVVPFLPFADWKITQDGFGAPIKDLLERTLPVFVACLGVLLLFARLPQRIGEAARTGKAWCLARPQRAIALCALTAVIASSYPVVFLGKSFVSPNLEAGLLYYGKPTLPGYTDTRTMEGMSDVGAMMWHHLPLSILEHRALFRDHELPLWDRYNSTGVPLLGQGQSMFGDPLHMILPVLFDGAAWAWDLKYLAAKWLLAVGLGLLVWHGTRHLPSALIVAFTSNFVGFFLYRFNHPSFFSFCYGPWILYCWMRAAGGGHVLTLDSRQGVKSQDMTPSRAFRSTACWTGGLMLANWAEMTSGTAKEAYMMLLSMNLTGALVLACASDPWRQRWRKLAILGWGGALFALLSAPIWLTFADALKRSFTNYDNPLVLQIEPSMLLGLFDEIFYRPFNAADGVINPSANFVLLLGVLAFLIYLRSLSANRLALAVAIGALVQLAFAFGLVPPLWIAQVPLLRNVVHIDDSFSCGLILNLAVLAGFGFHAAAGRLGRPEGRFDIVFGLLMLFALLFAYLGFTQVVLRGPHPYLTWGQVVPRSPFVCASLIVLPAAAIGLTLVARRMLVRQAATPASVILALTFAAVLLWRHGLQAGAGFTDYVDNPPVRADLHAKSPAVETVLADRTEPFRTAGIDWVLAAGWSGVYGIEGLGGPDSLMNGQYRELTQACGLDIVWGWRIVPFFQNLAALKPVYDFLNVKYYLDGLLGGGRAGAFLTPVARTDLEVYRSETPWPRAFFTDQVWRYGAVTELASLIRANPGRPFAAVQEGEPDAPSGPFAAANPAARAVVPARAYRLTTNRTSFEVVAPGPGVIVLQEAWVKKNFKATVNGEPAKYFRVNHAFKGVAVDRAGTYRVEFAYWPEDMTLSLALSAMGLVGLAGSAWFASRKK